ncbi:DUF309 domain-containing protein [Rhodococcus spelaei]|uniref:DUF309 domain-containing protein n=1 Tax=Rhodococcus spelaei TaxID=2546320 RepID=A0A541BRH1_9NOCA|nr:DUF309 domain-containing protein [Rhodococcus spelaei]TQF74931.1 DUF309 domain-containing protein [Rhodococcus spelaei]
MADAPGGPQLDLGATVTESQRLLDHGAMEEAGVLLASTARDAPAEELELWQGLALLIEGLTQAARGETAAATFALRRGRDLIGPYEDRPPHALDVSGLLGWSTHLVDELAAPDRPAPPVPRLRLP